MRNKRRRVPIFKREEDTDPLSVVVNLFDVAMVFAVALMVAMVMNMNMTEVFSKEDFTVVKPWERQHGNHLQKRKQNRKIHTLHRPKQFPKQNQRKKSRDCLSAGRRANHLCRRLILLI